MWEAGARRQRAVCGVPVRWVRDGMGGSGGGGGSLTQIRGHAAQAHATCVHAWCYWCLRLPALALTPNIPCHTLPLSSTSTSMCSSLSGSWQKI